MKNKIYCLCLALSSYGVVVAQNDKSVDLGMETTTELRKTQAVSTLRVDKIENNSTFNPYNTMFGLLPGLTAMQNVGWWDDNARLYVRGRGSLNGAAPLVVVDGYPRPIENIDVKDIETITVLKDGAATAIWGGRGANGVVLITTKRGKKDKKEINVRYTYGIGRMNKRPKFANARDYSLARNEALYYDGLDPEFTATDLMNFSSGGNSDRYPNSNWQAEALRNHTVSNQFGVDFRGGKKAVRYFSSIDYKSDMGLINPDLIDYTGRYNAQMRKYQLNVRMNLDIDIAKYTKLKLNLLGLLGEQTTPNKNEDRLFNDLNNIPSAAFPLRTVNGYWGGNKVYERNPIADIADAGFYKLNQRLLQADARLTQDLSPLLKGLNAEFAVAYDNNAVYQEVGVKKYAYQSVARGDEGKAVYADYGENTSLDIRNGGLNSQYIKANVEGRLLWNNTFGKNNISASQLFRHEAMILEERNKSRYHQYITTSVGYNYDNRYMVDALINVFGSSILPKGDKYRVFPALSAAWVVSNEEFMKDSKFNLLKLRASYGQSGYDGYPYELDKQYWVGGQNYFFGNKNQSAGGGLKEGRLALEKLELETANKFDVGIDVSFLNKLELSTDFFYDNRYNILINGNALVSPTVGLDAPMINDGEVNTYGLEFSTAWHDRVGKNFRYYLGGNISYVKTNVIENGEESTPYHFNSAKGKVLGQCFGLEAIGYFSDEEDIKNSPKQMFGEVHPGDIKYKDLNSDGIIDAYDRHAIGHSTIMPEVYYGLNFGVEYKGFGIDAVFQGAAGYSVMLNTASLYWPMRNNTNISEWYLYDNIRWTEQTKENANLPRLTTLDNKNNFQSSTQWLRCGDFFKLRNLNVYYNLPRNIVKRWKMQGVQLYVRGNNLFALDHIKYNNVEDLNAGYPDMKSFYLGLNLKF